MENIKNPIRILIASLTLGVLFTWFFRYFSLGISIPIFVTLFYFFCYHLNKYSLNFIRHTSLFFLVIIFLLSATFAIFDNEVLRRINIVLLPMLIVIQCFIMNREKLTDFFQTSFVQEIFHRFHGFFNKVHQVFLPLMQKVGGNEKSIGISKKIFQGCIIALPIVLVAIALLSSADMIFKMQINDFFSGIKELNTKSSIYNIITCAVISVFLIGFFQILAKKYTALHMKTIEQKGEKIKFDPVASSILLIALNGVYILFVMIQFHFIFGGESIIHEYEITYSRYAVRGFWQLMIVTIMNIGIVLSIVRYTDYSLYKIQSFIKILLTILCTCTIVMLISAHIRLSLYEMTYGYTHARIYAHTMIFLLGTFLAMSLYKIAQNSFQFFRGFVIVSLIFYVGLNYFNTEKFIADSNIQRYEETQKIDIYYLSKLSMDAFPSLMELGHRHPEILSSSEHGDINSLLKRYGKKLKEEIVEQDMLNPSWNYSRYRAKLILNNI